jgi:hypothetical protein
VESRFLLDVVVRESSAVFELLAGEDESLLVGRDAFLVLDLSLDVFDSVRGLNVQSDGLASQGLDEDLHATSESEDQVKGRLFLNVVVAEGSSVFKLLACEDQSLLIGGNSLLILDLGLDVLNGVRRLHIEGDGFACEGLHEDLHATSESEHEMEGRLFLNVVVAEGSSIFELLASEDESLLIRRDTFLVLDLGLDVFDGV